MKNRTIRRAVAATAIALCATTTVVACGSDDSTGDGGVGALTGDDARSEDNGDDQESDSSMTADEMAESMGLSASASGDTVEFTSGKKYEYSDGRTEFGDDAITYSVKLDNLRKIDIMTEPDPDAPADHPDSKGQVESIMMCFDVTTKIISDPYSDDYSMAASASSMAPGTLNPFIQKDGLIVSDVASLKTSPEVKAGEDHVIDYDNPLENLDSGSYRRAPSEDEIKQERKTDAEARCYYPNASGKDATSTPDGFTGYTVLVDPGESVEPGLAVWDLKLED